MDLSVCQMITYHLSVLKTAKIGISVQLWLLNLGYWLNYDYQNWDNDSTMSIHHGEISKFKYNRPFSMANDNISSLWRLRVLSYHHQGLKTAKIGILVQQ